MTFYIITFLFVFKKPNGPTCSLSIHLDLVCEQSLFLLKSCIWTFWECKIMKIKIIYVALLKLWAKNMVFIRVYYINKQNLDHH